jgi:hypothetical protein
MIYLFDENDQNQMSEQYQVDYLAVLPELDGVVSHISSKDQIEGLDIILKNAVLICIHDSFPTPDFKAEVVAHALEKGIPLVVFSGGAGFTISKFDEKENSINYNYLKQIKKDRFYYSFYEFAKNYKESGKINLQKLLFGNEYEKVRFEIIKDRLGKKIFGMRENFDYFLFTNADERSPNHQNRKDLWELFYFVYNGDTENEFSNFENEVDNNGLTPKDLYLKIHHLFECIQSKI